MRKIAYLLAAMLFAMVVGHRAHGQTAPGCYVWSDGFGGTFGDPASAAASRAPQTGNYPVVTSCPNANAGCTQTSLGSFTCTVSGGASPQSASCTATYTSTYHYGGSSATDPPITSTANEAVSQVAGPCAAQCSATSPPQDLLATLAANTTPGSANLCNAGCEYTNGNNTLVIGSATNRLAGMAIPTGNACGSSDATATNGSCVLKAGQTTCANDTDVAAIINGDEVQPSTASPPGTCLAFASGGVMCTTPMPVPVPATPATAAAAMQAATPPGPDNGTAGTPATPTQTVQAGGKTVNYYNASTVAGSSGPVNTTGSGSGNKPNGSGTGTSGDGKGNAGDCDQSASGGDAAGCTGTTPSLTRSDTVQSDIQTFMTGVNNTPMMQAINAIETAGGGSGTCPTETFTSVTLAGHTFDFMASACQVFEADVGVLQTISDAAWALLGALILVSA